MKKAILVLALSYLYLVGIAASAHVDGTRVVFSSCQVAFSSDVSINSDAITVSAVSGESLRIDTKNSFTVNGASQTLDAEQQALKSAVGDIVVSVGESVRDGDAEIMASLLDFAKKAEQSERDIEAEVMKKARRLEGRAEGLCDEVYALQAVESRMQLEISATRGFDMVKES